MTTLNLNKNVSSVKQTTTMPTGASITFVLCRKGNDEYPMKETYFFFAIRKNNRTSKFFFSYRVVRDSSGINAICKQR